YLRIVKARAARVGAGNKKLLNRIPNPASSAPFGFAVIARIFFQNARENCGRHIRADGVVSKRCAESLTVCAPALSSSFRGIIGLIDARQSCIKWKGKIVEYLRGRNPVLLSGSHGRQFVAIPHSSVIGHDFENPLIDGSGFALNAGFGLWCVGLL